MAEVVLFGSTYLVLTALLAWHDIRDGLLPDRFTCPLLWAGLLYCGWFTPQLLQEKVFGAIAGYTGFATIYWGYRLVRGHEGLGYGDVKFLSALGAWHGWQALCPLILVAVLLACCVVCVIALTTRDIRQLKNPLPFGPFLAGAGLVIGYQTFFTSLVNLRL